MATYEKLQKSLEALKNLSQLNTESIDGNKYVSLFEKMFFKVVFF